jgi:hypothetical protein
MKSFEPVRFPTFTAIVLVGIGDVPGTVEDRQLRIGLERRPHGQRRRRLRRKTLESVRDTVTPTLMAHADAIGAAMAAGMPNSALPPGLNDRDADNWEPLLAVAKLAGGNWPTRASAAAVALCAKDADDRGSEYLLGQIMEGVHEYRVQGIQSHKQWLAMGNKRIKVLQNGMKVAVGGSFCRFIRSDDLATWLINKDDSGFGDCRDLQAVKLRIARVLKPFKVKPTLRNVGGTRGRGYDVRELRAVWRQYGPR